MKPVATLETPDDIGKLVKARTTVLGGNPVTVVEEKFFLCHANNHKLARCARDAYVKQYTAFPRLQWVAQDEIRGVSIKTRFIGIDLRDLPNYPIIWGDDMDKEKPVVFEMIYDGEIVAHFQTWEQAEEGHKTFINSLSHNN